MSHNDRMAEVLDAATAGLAGDRELRLDVRAELASHLDDKLAELTSKGLGEEEATDLAIQSFGPATELAAALVRANARRMKLRALARLAIRAGLVPAAVVLTLAVCGGGYLRHYHLACVVIEEKDFGWFYGALRNDLAAARKPAGEWPPPAVPGGSRPTKAERQRAMTEAVRKSGTLCMNHTAFYLAPDLHLFEREVRAAAERDPDNAAYNYALAGMFAAQACDVELAGGYVKREYGAWRQEWKVMIRDRALLARAVGEILNGNVKPALRLRPTGAAKRPNEPLRRPRSIEELLTFRDTMGRRSLAAPWEAGPQGMQFLRYLMHAIPGYARLLADEGRAEEAKRALESWYPLTVRVMLESSSWYGLSSAKIDYAEVVERKWLPVYGELGEHEAARKWRRRLERLGAPIDREERRIHAIRYDEDLVRLRGRSSGRAPVDLPFGSETAETYAPGRHLDHTVAEGVWVSAFLALFVMKMLGAAVAALRWRFVPGTLKAALTRLLRKAVAALRRRPAPGEVSFDEQASAAPDATTVRPPQAAPGPRSKIGRDARSGERSRSTAAPILLLPSWREAATILGFAVLLPLAAFHVYTRWSGLAGREFSLSFLWPRFVLELVLLAVTILSLIVSMAARAVRRRCGEIDVPVPRRFGGRYRFLFWIALGVPWAMCLFIRGRSGDWPATRAAALVVVALVAWNVFAFARLTFGPAKHGLFYGTVARSLVPAFAAAAIIVGAVAHPYLTRREAALIQGDPALAADQELPYLGRAEADQMRRLRAEIGRVIKDIDETEEIEAGRRGPAAAFEGPGPP